MLVEPYLFFEGRCEEALEFYQAALDAEVTMLLRYKESPDASAIPPGAEEKIMHANLKIGTSTIMLSDGECSGKAEFSGTSLSLAPEDAETAGKYFDALSQGGEVQVPLGKTFWATSFGMLTDRFGVSWMINLEATG